MLKKWLLMTAVLCVKYLPNEPVITVQGEETNFKITHQQDIYLADNLIKDGLIGRMNHLALIILNKPLQEGDCSNRCKQRYR